MIWIYSLLYAMIALLCIMCGKEFKEIYYNYKYNKAHNKAFKERYKNKQK